MSPGYMPGRQRCKSAGGRWDKEVEMVAAEQPDMDERVALLEKNVQLLALAMDQARTWLVMLGSVNADRWQQLYELEMASIKAIEEVKRLVGGQ